MLITSTEIIKKEYPTPLNPQNLRSLYFPWTQDCMGRVFLARIGQDTPFCCLMISSPLSPSYGRNASNLSELVDAPVIAFETREDRGCVDVRIRARLAHGPKSEDYFPGFFIHQSFGKLFVHLLAYQDAPQLSS